MGNGADDDLTDRQTIRNYVDAGVETRQKIAVAYTGALENAQIPCQCCLLPKPRPREESV